MTHRMVGLRPGRLTASKIAFRSFRGSNPNNPNHEIYVMNADGSNQRNVTNHPAEDVLPDWSPDGKKIAFVSDRVVNFRIYDGYRWQQCPAADRQLHVCSKSKVVSGWQTNPLCRWVLRYLRGNTIYG